MSEKIAQMTKEVNQQTKESGMMNYDNYIKVLRELDTRQIENIITNFHTRVDESLKTDDWLNKLRLRAKLLIDHTPEHFFHLLACPMIGFRGEKFLDFLSKSGDLKSKTDIEIFWEFVDTFPHKDYYRAIRVQPHTNIDFYLNMLTGPNLQGFSDFGNLTYGPVVGDFEEYFTYHVYNRDSGGSLVSWAESGSGALTAATKYVDEYDPRWNSNRLGSILVVKVDANSFFFLDATEVNSTSPHPAGRESILVMSLPLQAIREGGISFEIKKKEDLQTLDQAT